MNFDGIIELDDDEDFINIQQEFKLEEKKN